MSLGQYQPSPQMQAKFGRVALLLGGTSAEREVSLLSGAAVLQALQSAGVDVTAIDAGATLVSDIENGNFDRIFIALHGRGGEDGTLQGMLDYFGLPYTTSGVLASALAMDKWRCKLLWSGLGLPTAPFALLTADTDWAAVLEQLGGAVMVKPANEGSSIGMGKARNAAELQARWAAAAKHDSLVIAEHLLSGPEYTVAVVGGEVMPPIRIEAMADFYDYNAKYISDETRYHCPCGLPEDEVRAMQQLAKRAFDAVGCSVWGRVDLMADASGELFLLEVNTVPGMTSHSLVPMAAKVAGYSFEQLVVRILEQTL